MPTIPKYLDIAAPLQTPEVPPVRQREVITLDALFLVRPDADELATFFNVAMPGFGRDGHALVPFVGTLPARA
jgi:hypothetical protein